ncbi:hypothetical protein [Hoeflea sp.]|uniref:hypothetical protein n=1 Tax=Hoeflea sp. TaxID=1940281 RepID=UPI003A93C73B
MTVIAVIFALVIGVAGGYAAFRFTQPDTSGVVNTPADDAQIIELEAKIAGQAGELDAMAEKLDALSITAQLAEEKTALAEKLAREVYTLAAENETLKAKLVAAEAQRDAVNQDASVAEDRDTAELARLREEVLPELTAERDQLQRKNLMMLADQTNLKARAKAAAEVHTADAKRIAELEARLAEVEAEPAASQEVLDALKLAERVGQAPEVVAENSDPATKPELTDNSAPDPRKRDMVARALRVAPGLETLSEAERQKLEDTLIAGECVTTALKSVFERVPILTLRNLIRDLNSDC